jgi:hypothetical protein
LDDEIRKQQGIYYTPEFITDYIVRQTLLRVYMELLADIHSSLKNKEHETVKRLIEKWNSIKILDPSCGSGAFLICALELIWIYYGQLHILLNHYDYPFERGENFIVKIILRHLYGNDLDANAISELKLNISHEAKKLDPFNIQFELDMNFTNGDSLVGLPENLTIQYLLENHSDQIKNLFEFRQLYLSDPSNLTPINEIKKIKAEIRNGLDSRFENYLKELKLSEEVLQKTTPFYWALEFWHVYIDENLKLIERNNRGFDLIIGNPPYISTRELSKAGMDGIKDFLRKNYESAYKGFDLSVVFLEKGLNLLKNKGDFSYIITNKFLITDYGLKIRKFILNHAKIITLSNISKIRVFQDASTYPIIIQLKKDNVAENRNANIINVFTTQDEQEFVEKNYEITNVPQSLFNELPNNYFLIDITTTDLTILDLIRTNSTPLVEVANDMIQCGTTGFDSARYGSLITETPPNPDDEYSKKFIVSGNIMPYIINWGKKINYLKTQFEKPYFVYDPDIVSPGKWKLYQARKIVIRGMALKLTAAIDDIGYAMGVSTYGVIDSQYDFKYIVGILNSHLFDYYYKIMYSSKHLAGGYIGFNEGHIKQIPIHNPKNTEEEALTALVSEIIDCFNSYNREQLDGRIEDLGNRLNALIFKIYQIKEKHIKFILNKLDINKHTKERILEIFQDL